MSKKKRNKKYRPAEGNIEKPVIHQYVAEEEDRTDKIKSIKRRSILWSLGAGTIALLAWWIF